MSILVGSIGLKLSKETSWICLTEWYQNLVRQSCLLFPLGISWVHRNKTRLKEQAVPLDKIRDTAKTYLELFYASRDSLCGCKPRNPARNRRWQPPKPGEYKLNSDGAMFNESQEAGIGIVIRNSASQVLASLAEKIRKPCTVEHLETLAASRAVIFAAELGL